MTILDVIARKRDGQKHSQADLQFLAEAAAGAHDVADYQLSAWLMATYVNGLDEEETLWLTLAMADSGERLNLSQVPKPWLDKHSTGGVGDKTTLVLLPLLSACGITMVKMSGRGLGITGGTIDKLESIPGFRTDLTPQEMVAQANKIGLAITGQSPNLAPADKTLYALRDTTGTVGSLPLIVSSILSKKIAGGADHLVLDVKAGSGAFMPDLESAQKLAKALHGVATAAGIRTSAAITDMSRPLGRTVGNALEVREAIEVLEGATGRFTNLCCELAAGALDNVGIANSLEQGRAIAQEKLSSGAAFDKWNLWVKAQTNDLLSGNEVADKLPVAPVILDIHWAGDSGYVSSISAKVIGQTVVDLGGGRKRKSDPVDHSVGIEVLVSPGQPFSANTVVARIHASSEVDAQGFSDTVRRAFGIQNDTKNEDQALLEWSV